MNFAFATPRRRRRPSLTPMIDVVFLLLVFFMVVARFGGEGAVVLSGAGGAGGYDGPPRLVDVRPDTLALNGLGLDPGTLVAELGRLAASPDDAVVLRPRDGASLQDLVDAMTLLRGAGFARLLLVE